MSYFEILFLLGGGLLSGFMNTLASSGSAITLPLMIFFGLSPSVANATNRIPILVSSAISVQNYNKSKSILWPKALKTSIPTIAGSIVGALMVSYFEQTTLQALILIAMIFSFLIIITNSRSILKGRSFILQDLSYRNYLLFFFIGIWFGLIVLDSAILILFELIIGCGLDLKSANPIKNFLILAASIAPLIIFNQHTMINWKIGAILSTGSFFGGYWGSKISHLAIVRKWIYRFLIFIIGVEIIRLISKFF